MINLTLDIVLNILAYYSIGAIATGILSYFTVYRPILKTLAEEGYEVTETLRPLLTAVVLMITTAIFAPFILKTALCGPDQDFIDGYIEGVLEEEED